MAEVMIEDMTKEYPNGFQAVLGLDIDRGILEQVDGPRIPAEQRIRAPADQVEALGFERIACFNIDAEPVFSEDALDLEEDVELLPTGETPVAGCFDPESTVKPGDSIEIAATTDNFHFFDPETALAIRS